MTNAGFRLMSDTIDVDVIDGKMSAYAKVPYGLQVMLPMPLAENGYGTVSVNGIKVPEGKTFAIDVSVYHVDCILVPVGSVVREYDKEYSITFQDFRAADGSAFEETTLKFRTLPRRKADDDPVHRQHDQATLEVAREGMVLLKNDEKVLPLAPDATLNCFGPGQFMYRITSTGASLINPRWMSNFVQSVEEHSQFTINQDIADLYVQLQTVVPSEEQLRLAKEKNDTALIFISRESGEFIDNRPVPGNYYLTEDEKKMIAAVTSVFAKTVAIINTGYPIDMKWTEEYHISSILYTGFAGQSSGYALMEILDGRCNPSGKLPDTWMWDYYDAPASRNFINLKAQEAVPGEKDYGVLVYYEEDIYVGYRYFDSFDVDVAYSFGHGLSYTNFDIVPENVSYDAVAHTLTARVVVTNTGNASGKEVVQLYVAAPETGLEKPKRVFAAFEKTKELAPGESQRLTLVTEDSVFASFDEDNLSYIMDAGVYRVYIGNSLATSVVADTFIVPEKEILRAVEEINPPMEKFHRITKADSSVKCETRFVELENRIPTAAPREKFEPKPLQRKISGVVTYKQLKEDHNLLDDFVAQMTVQELCTMNVCGGANWYGPDQNGEAGKTNVIEKYEMPQMLVSDGNPGINMKKPNIGFPCSTVECATFNKELAYLVGHVIGEESKENNIGLNLGPAMNLHRNILNGRHPEYYSEDPYLGGMMAGYHAKGLRDAGTGCTYKHLFCNNSDSSRKGSHSIVSTRALRELYYKIFEVAISVQKPDALMTGYNAVNGIYPAEDARVLQKLIRGEWGLKSFIMTDWGTYDTVDPVEMVKAGNGWLTEGGEQYIAILKEAVEAGRLSRAVLESNVRDLIYMMIELDI